MINASPGDLAPVFDAMLEKAMRLCEAAFGSLVTYDGEYFHARRDAGACRLALAEALRERGPLRPSQSVAYDQIVRGADIVHIPDITALGIPFPSSPNIDQDGARTTLFVALRGDDALLGVYGHLPEGGAPVLRQADRTAEELRRPGGDRDGKRAADHRDSARRWSSRPRPPRCCR